MQSSPFNLQVQLPAQVATVEIVVQEAILEIQLEEVAVKATPAVDVVHRGALQLALMA